MSGSRHDRGLRAGADRSEDAGRGLDGDRGGDPDRGGPGSWEGLPIVEVLRATLDVYSPKIDDPIIAQRGDPERLAWMHANFTDHSRVAELGEADSYATRLYDYAHAGRDQIRWVIDRLAANPWARDVAITTFQPLTDTGYITCVSLLDFWLVKGKLQLAVYAHAIDFGTKGYANLVELAALQTRVAGDFGAGVGTLTMTVKSAHIYQTELGLMRRIVAATQVNDSQAPDRSGRAPR
jgi:thymidylate synthase